MPVHNHWFTDPNTQKPAPAALARYGPVAQVELHIPAILEQAYQAASIAIPAPIIGWALVDTGATRTAVDDDSINSLGVSAIGTTTVQTAGGPKPTGLYPVRIRFPGMNSMQFDFNSVASVDLNGQSTPDGKPLVCLIGRDVLAAGMLVYNGVAGLWTFSI